LTCLQQAWALKQANRLNSFKTLSAMYTNEQNR
jgi:hypothetical protein